jgi:hypothetical protein
MSDTSPHPADILARVRQELASIAQSSESIDRLLAGNLPKQEQQKIELVRRTVERLERELAEIAKRLEH